MGFPANKIVCYVLLKCQKLIKLFYFRGNKHSAFSDNFDVKFSFLNAIHLSKLTFPSLIDGTIVKILIPVLYASPIISNVQYVEAF